MTQRFFVTYGNNLINHFSIVEAEDYLGARMAAHAGTDGGKFAFMYSDNLETAEMIEKYGLTEVPLQAMEV